MRTIWALTLKDLRLLTRDRMGMFFVLVFPVLLGLFMGVVFSRLAEEFGNIEVGVTDEDQSHYSRQFVRSLGELGGTRTVPLGRDEAMRRIRQGSLYGYVRVPSGFGKRAGRIMGTPPTVYATVDPSKHAAEEIVHGAVLKSMLSVTGERFSRSLLGRMSAWAGEGPALELVRIELEPQSPPAASGPSGAPGLGAAAPFELAFPMAMMWGGIGCVASFAATMVREKNEGTFLRLMAAPLPAWRVVVGKALACFLAVCGVMTMLVVLGGFWGVRAPQPGKLAVAILASSYCFVGMMMLLSVFGRTERAVDSAAWAVLLVLCMLGGGMVPLEFLPSWIQRIGNFSPVKWSIVAIEGALWRDFSAGELLGPLAILMGIGTGCMLVGGVIFRRGRCT